MTDHSSVGHREINHRFGCHKATFEGENATIPTHAQTRVNFRIFAETMDALLPAGRAKSVFFTELESASMWAHKAINEEEPLQPEPGYAEAPLGTTRVLSKQHAGWCVSQLECNCDQ